MILKNSCGRFIECHFSIEPSPLGYR